MQTRVCKLAHDYFNDLVEEVANEGFKISAKVVHDVIDSEIKARLMIKFLLQMQTLDIL